MRRIENENVLQMLGVCMENGKLPKIIFPKTISLKAYLRSNRKNINAIKLLRFGQQFAKGMVAISENGFVHRNIRLDNVLLDEKSLKIKIGNFSLTRDVNTGLFYYIHKNENSLPKRWMSPESIEKHMSSTQSDVIIDLLVFD